MSGYFYWIKECANKKPRICLLPISHILWQNSNPQPNIGRSLTAWQKQLLEMKLKSAKSGSCKIGFRRMGLEEKGGSQVKIPVPRFQSGAQTKSKRSIFGQGCAQTYGDVIEQAGFHPQIQYYVFRAKSSVIQPYNQIAHQLQML